MVCKFIHLSDLPQKVDSRDELLRAAPLRRRRFIATVLHRVRVEPFKLPVHIFDRSERSLVPEFARKNAIVALDGGLCKRPAGHGEDRDDLIAEQKVHHPTYIPFTGSGSNGDSRIVHFDAIGLFEAVNKILARINKVIRGGGPDSLKMAKLGMLFKRKPDEMQGLCSAPDVFLTDKIGFHNALAQFFIYRVLRITKISGSTFYAMFSIIAGKTQILEHFSNGAKRWDLLVGIISLPGQLNGSGAPVK